MQSSCPLGTAPGTKQGSLNQYAGTSHFRGTGSQSSGPRSHKHGQDNVPWILQTAQRNAHSSPHELGREKSILTQSLTEVPSSPTSMPPAL